MKLNLLCTVGCQTMEDEGHDSFTFCSVTSMGILSALKEKRLTDGIFHGVGLLITSPSDTSAILQRPSSSPTVQTRHFRSSAPLFAPSGLASPAVISFRELLLPNFQHRCMQWPAPFYHYPSFCS